MPTVTKRILIPMGNSHGITLPQEWIIYNDLKAGDMLEVVEEYNMLHIKILNNGGEKDYGNDKSG